MFIIVCVSVMKLPPAAARWRAVLISPGGQPHRRPISNKYKSLLNYVLRFLVGIGHQNTTRQC